jgi:hypothetical protein
MLFFGLDFPRLSGANHKGGGGFAAHNCFSRREEAASLSAIEPMMAGRLVPT